MIFSSYGHDTHAGNVRSHNEDSYKVDPGFGLSVLADGMGGHEGGEVASHIVVEHVDKAVRNGEPLAQAVVGAHHAVLEAVEKGQGRAGMGSTALALLVNSGNFEIAWVGDSRAYLWNGEQLTQLTKDHSLVQHLVDQGEITEEEARTHPQRNYITQAIGMTGLRKLQVGQINGRLHDGQQILLCSDGLSGEVSTPEMEEILKLDIAPQQKVDLLIQKALDNGGGDNVTVLLIAAKHEN